MRTLRLGLRLARGAGRAGWVRLALMAAGGAVAMVGLLSALALYGLMPRQQARADSLALQIDPSRAAPSDVHVDQASDSWDGRPLLRVDVAVTGPQPLGAPGIERWPEPGEVILSPALARLARREPLVARRFPQRVIGTLDRSALVTPDDLVAWVGVEAGQFPAGSGAPLTGVGAAADNATWYKSVTSRTLAVLVVLTLVAPALMLMGTCTRLSATTRSQRLAALRLLGLGRRRTQRVNAVETGLAGLAGGVAGIGAWVAWLRAAPEGRLGSLSWYASDLVLSPVAVAAALAVLVALAVVVGAAGSRAAVRQPLRVRREGSVRPVSSWRIVPLVAGIGLLGISWATAGDGVNHASLARWLVPFGAGLALTALGLVLAVPFLALAVGRLLHRAERPAALLASGRLRHEPAVAGRILAGLTVAVFAAGTAQVVLVAVRAGALALDESSVPPVVALEARVPAGAAEADLRAVSDRGVAFPAVDLAPDVTAVLASSADLRAATGRALAGCDAGLVYRVQPPDPSYMDSAPVDVDAVLTARGLPPATGALSFELVGTDAHYVPDLVVPPGMIPSVSGHWFVAFDGDAQTDQRAVAALAERFPTARYMSAFTGVDRMDAPRLYTDVIAYGTVAALAVGLVALVVASIDRAVERRGALTHVAALGTPARTIRSALVLQTLPVSALALTAAGLAAVVGGSSYLRWETRVPAGLPLGVLAGLILLSVAASALATALAVAGSVARVRPDLLRSE